MTEIATEGVSRRTFLKGTAATAAALALPANRLLMPSQHPKGAAGDTLTIGFPSNGFTEILKLLEGFTKSTGITITPFNQSGGGSAWTQVFQTISTRIAGGEPVDSAYIATEGMLLFELQDLLVPLNSYISTDQNTMSAFYKDLNPQMLANFRALDNINGRTYFIPIGYNVMSIWYNRALFKQFKLPEPAPGWTWDDFEKAATTIADPPNRYGFALNQFPGPFTDVYPWVLTNGGYILNPSQSKCVAGSSQSIEAATFVRNLVKKKAVNAPGAAYNALVEMYAGRLGMAGGGMWLNLGFPAGTTQKQINEAVAIVPWPISTKAGTPVGVGGFPMFKSCSNKPAMWEFIKYSFSDEFQNGPVVPLGGDMPIRISVATDPSFINQWPQGTNYFTEELAYSTMIVGVPNASAVENQISNTWESILTGAVSPSTGMQDMQTNCTNLMAQKIG
jgi:multiple sugar transport system substrate-binding protein